MVILGWRENIGGNIMSEIINSIQNRNLPLISFYLYIFSINKKDSTEMGTILSSDVCTMRKRGDGGGRQAIDTGPATRSNASNISIGSSHKMEIENIFTG